MQKLFICLTIAFFTYCLPDELNHQSVQTPPIFKDVFSNQQQLPLSLYSCDTYKHRNTVVYSPTNSEHYTAAQWQQYFHNNNYCEKQILEQELLYLSDEFVKLAKTYAGYNQAIENLHKKFEKFGVCKKVLHAFAGSYAAGLKLRIKQLYQEIQFKKEYQERQTNRQFAEYQELKTIYTEHSPLLAKAIERRIDAQRYGSQQLQNVLELESTEIFTQAKLLSPCSILYPHQEVLIDCATAVSDYNKEGLLGKAMCVADFCWSLLDYGQAIAEGVTLGVYSAVHDILTNPIEATISIVAGKQVLAFQLCKVLYNVADIGITAITNFDVAKEKWDRYAAPLNNIIDVINKKEITVRDAIKGGTAFVVGYKAQGKLLGGLGKFCKTIKHKSINFAKNNPLLNPQDYLITPEGLLFKVASKSNKLKQSGQVNNASNLKNSIDNKIAKTVSSSDQNPAAILKNDYYEVNGFKFTQFYYNRLWDNGRKCPGFRVESVLRGATNVVPDPQGHEGFFKYVYNDWEMIFNPSTKIVAHLSPIAPSKRKLI